MGNGLKSPGEKRGGILALKIIGAFCLVGTVVVYGGMLGGIFSVDFSKEGPSIWFLLLFYPVTAVVCLTAAYFKERKRQKNYYSGGKTRRAQSAPKKEISLVDEHLKESKARHVAGLSVSEEAECRIRFENSGLRILGERISFILPYKRIISMQIQTQQEVENHYVSGVGNAVLGASLFGLPGAIFGGRIRKIQDVRSYHFLTVTYLREEDRSIAAVMFAIDQPRRFEKAIDCVSPYFCKEQQTVRL